MRFEWDEDKDRANLRKHDVRFETAVLVFDDPYSITQADTVHGDDEERFITIGAIEPGSVLFVVHAWRDSDDEQVIQIISARAASARERKLYEEAYKRAKAGHRGHRRQN